MRVGGGLSVGLNMLSAMGRVGSEHEFLCVVPPGLGYEEAVASMTTCQLVTHRHTGYLNRWKFESFQLPRLVREFSSDVVLALGGRGILHPGCPQAAFPQDPHFFYPASHFGLETRSIRLKKLYHKSHFVRQLKATQLVLVQTEVVERRLRQSTGYQGDVFVCGTSVSPTLRDGPAARALPDALSRHGAKFKLLYLTRYYAHKNLEILVRLFREHGDELKDVTVVTTVAPDHHPNAASFLRSIEQHGLEENILNVGPIPHSDVGGFYEHCDGLLMPTLLETFGIPYLEAMAMDLPILTSDLDFAHAVCGDAAIFFDPWSPRAICDAINRLRANGDLGKELIANGKNRVSREFPSWDDIASSVLERLVSLATADKPCGSMNS